MKDESRRSKVAPIIREFSPRHSARSSGQKIHPIFRLGIIAPAPFLRIESTSGSHSLRPSIRSSRAQSGCARKKRSRPPKRLPPNPRPRARKPESAPENKESGHCVRSLCFPPRCGANWQFALPFLHHHRFVIGPVADVHLCNGLVFEGDHVGADAVEESTAVDLSRIFPALWLRNQNNFGDYKLPLTGDFNSAIFR